MAKPAFPGKRKRCRIGMSAPADQWADRVVEVGPGVTARRIFANLTPDGTDQLDLVEQALGDGVLPVVSYKGNNPDSAQAAADRLASYKKAIAVVYWHEPYPELTPGQFVAGVQTLMPLFKRPHLTRGCFLNGWLLDRGLDRFDEYCPDSILRGGYWDWVGIDTYQAGTLEQPGRPWPGDRIPILSAYLTERGYPDLPIAIGEYNGYSGEVIADATEKILEEPRVWLACLWNSTAGKGYALDGDRLEAFRRTLTDPRIARATHN